MAKILLTPKSDDFSDDIDDLEQFIHDVINSTDDENLYTIENGFYVFKIKNLPFAIDFDAKKEICESLVDAVADRIEGYNMMRPHDAISTVDLKAEITQKYLRITAM